MPKRILGTPDIEPFWYWLEEARHRALNALAKAGLPTQVDQETWRVTSVREDGHGFESQGDRVPKNILCVDEYSWSIWHQFNWPDRAPLLPIAQLMVDLLGDRCRYFRGYVTEWGGQMTPGLTFESDAATWVMQAYFHPICVHYLRGLTDPAVGDRELFDRLAHELVTFATGHRWHVEEQIPIAGLMAEDPIESGNVSLRPCTPEEMATWADPPLGVNYRRFGRLALGGHGVPTHVLVIRYRTPKVKQYNLDLASPEIVQAIQLLGYRVSAPSGRFFRALPRWAEAGKFSSPLDSTKKFERRPFGLSDLERAIRLSTLPGKLASVETESREGLALRRFLNALSRDQAVDRLLDCVIALEAILLGGEESELIFRFKTYGAWWLAQNESEREQLFAQLGKLYSLRSKIVHGNKFPAPQAIEDAAREAVEIAQRAVTKALVDGWPAQKTFQRLSLGIT